MKKLIILAMMACSVSGAAVAQTYGTKDPGASGILKRTTRSNTVIATPGVDYVIPAGVTKSAVGLGNVDNTSDVNKPVSTAQATAIATKAAASHTHAATDVTQDATHRFVTDAEKATWNAGGSGSGIAEPTFASISYASTINIDFSSTTYAKTTATGNISFTNTNETGGQYFEYAITKNTGSNITLSFPNSDWTAPSIVNNAVGTATVFQTSPPGFTLTGASGSVYLLSIKYVDTKPFIVLNAIPNFYDPSPLATNMVVYDGRASFVDPGLTTAETSVYHVLIPGGLMKSNSKCTINFQTQRANSGENTVRVKVRAGTSLTPTANTEIYNFGPNNNGIMPTSAFFFNNASVSSQLFTLDYNINPYNYSVNTSSMSLNTANDFYLDITVTKTTSTHTGAVGFIEVILSNI